MRKTLNATPVLKRGTVALFVLVSALALGARAAAGAVPEAQSGEITPGKGVGPITLSMPLQDLVRLWGRPEQEDRVQDGVDRYDYSEARGVFVFLKDDRVVQFLVVTPAWSTPSGAKVGTPWPEVRAFLGQPDETLPGQTPGESQYWYRQRGIGFILRGRSVAAIIVHPAANAPASHGVLDDLLGKGRRRGQGGR